MCLCDYGSSLRLTAYATLRSGSCETHNMETIQDKTECEQAATLLGLPCGKNADSKEISSRPYGCIYTGVLYMPWDHRLELNLKQSSVKCASNKYHHECICRLGPGKRNF